VKCAICGGSFERRPVTISEEGRPDRVVQLLCCIQCGDTAFSPEQYAAFKNKYARGADSSDQEERSLTKPPEVSMTLTADQRRALLREVYQVVTGSVESLEHDDYIGPDLAYLLGAILNDTGCAWPQDRAIVTILREHFPDNHPVYRFIEIESE
jgi:hypothetical protein